MKLSKPETLNLDNVFACLEVKGENSDGKEVYVYFGVFLDDLERLISTVENTGSFNPVDFNAAIIARSEGEPSDEIKNFLQEKFGFEDGQVTLEIS